MTQGMVDGRARKSKSAFRMECGVSIAIEAPAEKVWSLLTNAADFPRWNTTVERIDGTIARGQKIQIRVPAAPGRVFKPTVSEFEPARKMVWSDGFAPMFKGVRTFTLTPGENGTTVFQMVEVFRGAMLPMIAGALPDFGPPFEQYAQDLKKEAEKR